jgi:hypothetical protein
MAPPFIEQDDPETERDTQEVACIVFRRHFVLQRGNGGSYVAVIPSWLAAADRAVADDARLRVDVRVRRPRVAERLVWMLPGTHNDERSCKVRLDQDFP